MKTIGSLSKRTGESLDDGARYIKYPNMVKLEQNPDYSVRPPLSSDFRVLKVKVKVTFYLTSVVPSVPTRLLSLEADGAPSTPPATVSAPF